MKGFYGGAIFLLLSTSFARADRPQWSTPSNFALLDSPLYQPLAAIAFHVQEIYDAAPNVEKHLLNEDAHHAVFRFMMNRLNRLKPMLRHVTLLASSPVPQIDEPGTEIADLTAAFNNLRRIMKQVHSVAGQLSVMHKTSGHPAFHSSMQRVQNGVKQAFSHAAALHPSLLGDSKRKEELGTKYIIDDFMPSGEKFIFMKQEVESSGQNRPGHLEDMVDRWENAHQDLQKTAKGILALIQYLKASLAAEGEWPKLHALAALLADGDAIQALGPSQFEQKLRSMEFALSNIVHDEVVSSPIELPKGIVPFQQAIILAHQVDSQVIPVLKVMNEELHQASDILEGLGTRATIRKRYGLSFIPNTGKTDRKSHLATNPSEGNSEDNTGKKPEETHHNAETKEQKIENQNEDELEDLSDEESEKTRENLIHGVEPVEPRLQQMSSTKYNPRYNDEQSTVVGGWNIPIFRIS